MNLQISNSVLLISNQDTNIADIDFILDRYEGQQRDQGIPKDLSVVHLIGHLNTQSQIYELRSRSVRLA